MKRLTCCDKAYIRGLSDGGVEAKEIATRISMSLSGVYRVLSTEKDDESPISEKKVGRPSKLSQRDERAFAIYAKKNRRSTLTEITNSGANEVSICTVRKALKNAGLNSRIAKKKPFLKESHIKNRREFVKNYSSWTMDEWKNVIWTDESSIELGHNSRQVRVWRNEEDAYLEECLVPTFKSGRSSIMVWGAIAWGKKSELVVLEKGRRTASDFVDQVYEGGLLRFLEGFSTPILMEDGAPIHRAIVAKNWRESHGVTKMVWPAQSPDMNPIENVWKILKDEVQKRFQQGMSLETYKDVVIEAWNSIEIEKINSLIEGVPGRLECLKKTRGGSTRF